MIMSVPFPMNIANDKVLPHPADPNGCAECDGLGRCQWSRRGADAFVDEMQLAEIQPVTCRDD